MNQNNSDTEKPLEDIEEVFSLDDLNTIVNWIWNEIFYIINNKTTEITKFEKLLVSDSLSKFNLKLKNVYINRWTHEWKLLDEVFSNIDI